MCVSINRPGDPDLRPFDLETGTRIASNVRNIHSECGHARPSGSPVIRYVRDGQTDGRKQTLLPLPTGGSIIIQNSCTLRYKFQAVQARHLRPVCCGETVKL